MLGRRAAGNAETLRFGPYRLRLRPWSGQPDTGHLVLLTPGAAVADAAASRAVETAAARGYRRLRTSALSSIESEPFLRTGFETCQQLALLTRPIKPRSPQDALPDQTRSPQDALPDQSGSIAIRKARRRDHPTVLAVDHAAFEPFWQLDQAGLQDALRATPFRHFRVASFDTEPTLTGYAISGRSGPAGYLQRLAIEPGQQGRGAGAALIIDGLAWMARRGATQAWVNTPQHNKGALRLYERLGFELIPPGLQVLELDLGQ